MQPTYSIAPCALPWPPLSNPSYPITSAQPEIDVPAPLAHLGFLFSPRVKVYSQATHLGCVLKGSLNQQGQKGNFQSDLTLFRKESHRTLTFESEGLRENSRVTPSGETSTLRDTVSHGPQKQH